MIIRPGRLSSFTEQLRQRAGPLETAADLDPLLEAIGDARYVLLGEATHGTAEFYTWRAALSKRLILEKGFSFVAVEGDWPDCYRVNRYVKALDRADASAGDALRAFSRWPTWMWANREVEHFVEWLRAHNEGLRSNARGVGFYGLDVYSLWESMEAVVVYLDRVDPDAARAARAAYECFDPYFEDVHRYAHTTAMVPESCEDEVVGMLRTLRGKADVYPDDAEDGFFSAEQNAIVAQNAERYYRTMVRGDVTSWNIRDNHMVETLERLMHHHGPHSRGIVWEHNTHVGDARFTDMRRDGMVNVGQLVRETHGESPRDREGVMIVGFGTHSGAVIAGTSWGAPMRRMKVPPARAGSWESLLHETLGRDALFVFDGSEDGGVAGLDNAVDHRAIGVVYNPRTERWGNYVPSVIPRRYDAFAHVEVTHAVSPLHVHVVPDHDLPETYPSGV